MNGKRVVLRERVSRDAEAAVRYYRDEAGERVALGFVHALEDALVHIGRFPGAGSLRYAHELDLPGVRAWRLGRYPYVVFYVERDDHVDVWRLLHAERDMAVWLSSPEGS